jgi:hypothetical protein
MYASLLQCYAPISTLISQAKQFCIFFDIFFLFEQISIDILTITIPTITYYFYVSAIDIVESQREKMRSGYLFGFMDFREKALDLSHK